MQDITTHIMHHMVEGIQKYGPVYGTWMYPFERFNRSVYYRVQGWFTIIMKTWAIEQLHNLNYYYAYAQKDD